jgi:WD40 repeat protein
MDLHHQLIRRNLNMTRATASWVSSVRELLSSSLLSMKLCVRAAVMVLVGSTLVTAVVAKQSGVDSMHIRVESDLPTRGAAVAVAWSPDGSALAAASDYGGELTVWDRNGHVVKRITRVGGGPTLWGSLAFINGSAALIFPPPEKVSASTAFAVWDVATGQIVRMENGPQPDAGRLLNLAVHFMTSPDQALLAVATGGNRGSSRFEKNVILYDTRSWRVLHTSKFPDGISSLCVFAAGRLLGLGSMRAAHIAVLDTSSGATITDIQAYEESKYGTASLGAIAGSPTGDLIMVGIGSALLQGQYIGTPEQRAWDETINTTDAVRILRVQDGVRIASFPAAKAPIRQAMWDPKGRYVAFVDNQRGLFLWAPWAGSGYQKIDLPTKTLSLAIAPDGERIAVTTDSGVRVYSLN